MADFCMQCSIENFGEDCEDLAGFSSIEDTKQNIFSKVLCEGCGWTLVDHKGRCVADCDLHHYVEGQSNE